jgi:hypothetical protein
MKVSKRTPKTGLAQRVIGIKALGIVKEVADKLGFPEKDIEEELTLLALLSTRIQFDNDEIGFSLLLPNDTEEQIAEKFIDYLNSDSMESINKAWNLLSSTDPAPEDAALGPTAQEDKDNSPN